MSKVQKSHAFLSVAVIPANLLDYVKTTYLLDPAYSSESEVKYLYAVLTSAKDLKLFKELPAYEDSYVKNDNVVVVLKFSDADIHKIVAPFLMGKYSQIDREYVKKNFFPTIHGNPSLNRLILDKSRILRAYWKDRLGMELPEGAEV